MRSIDDIVEQCKQADKFFDFTIEVLVPYLPFDRAQPFLIDSAKAEEWKQAPLTASTVIEAMHNYMEFSWEKAQDHRGLSAMRSVSKMQAWRWLLEDEETYQFAIADSSYAMYGAPILKKISEKYGFPIPHGEDIDNMMQGKPCSPGCSGCRS